MRGHVRASRSYSDRTLKILWGRAAGRCAVSSCRVDLIVDDTDYDPVVLIGEVAHIAAASDRGPRSDPNLAVRERDDYENLILLCRNCHSRLDGQKHSNPEAAVRQLKADHEAWVRAALPERGRTTRGWLPIIIQGDHPVDVRETLLALHPDFSASVPAVLNCPYEGDWTKMLSELRAQIETLKGAGDPFEKRFAVFPLAPVSACVATGYLFTNRPNVRLFQYRRQRGAWTWPNSHTPSKELIVDGTRRKSRASVSKRDVAVCLHLSAEINTSDLPPPFSEGRGVINIRVPHPSVYWLVAQAQLDWLGEIAATTFEELCRIFPKAEKWHLFYAGPAAGAVKIGQQLNPTMSPVMQLYEFSKASQPHYRPSMLLAPF